MQRKIFPQIKVVLNKMIQQTTSLTRINKNYSKVIPTKL